MEPDENRVLVGDEPSINMYCDESCHLEHICQGPMLFGCIWTPTRKAPKLAKELKLLQQEYKANIELKWQKVSPKNLEFYLAVVHWFFLNNDLRFRALVVPDKSKLEHARQEHDDFYYKMYYWLLFRIIHPDQRYNIYLDIKDTRSRYKVKQLRENLCFDKYGFAESTIDHLKSIRSDHSRLMQVADFLLGAVSYRHRGQQNSSAKLLIAKRIEAYLGRKLTEETPPGEDKFDIFVWQPRGRK